MIHDTIPSPPPSVRIEPMSGTFPAAPECVKHCACGLSFDPTEWAALDYVGVSADEVQRLELRNCPCGSTLAVDLDTFPDVTAVRP